MSLLHESFFVAGGTVPPGSPSYVERSADRALYDALLSGEYCYVLNSRQMGKSSLAVRTVSKLSDAGVRTAFVDLTRIGGANVSSEQWYAGLLAETGRVLDLRKEAVSFLREHKDIPPSQRYLSFLHEVALPAALSPLVLMLDEIDAVRSLSFSTDEFFAGIRQLHNGRAFDPSLSRLSICLLGAALPSDLIRDARTTPFNVGKRIELKDFTNEESQAFSPGLSMRSALPFSGNRQGEETLVRVMYWTGGHPFLTQTLCQALANFEGETSVEEVDRLVRERYLDARARETDTNLADVANRLLGRGDPGMDEAKLADVLSTFERLLKGQAVQDDEANPSAARIKMSGVARLENGQLKIRNRIYQEVFGRVWIRENMPGQEFRRQRRAFWRGALRTLAGSLAVCTVLTVLTMVAIQNAREANRARRESERRLYEARMVAAGQELISGRLPTVRRILDETAKSPDRDLEWWLLHGQTDIGLKQLGANVAGYGVRFSPDGKTFWNNESPGFWEPNGVVQGYSVDSWRRGPRLKAPGGVSRLAVSPDSRTVAAGCNDGRIALWAAGGGSAPKMLEGFYGVPGNSLLNSVVIFSIDFSAHGRLFAAGTYYERGGRGTVLIYRASDGKLVRRVPVPGSVSNLRFSPDGRWIALGIYREGQPGRACLIDAGSGKVVKSVPAHPGFCSGIAWAADSKHVFTAGADGRADRRSVPSLMADKVYEARVDHPIYATETHQWPRYVGHSPFATVKGPIGILIGVAVSPDGRSIATSCANGPITLWNEATGDVRWQISPIQGEADDLEFSPDGRKLAVSSQNGDATTVFDVDRAVRTLTLSGVGQGTFGSVLTTPAFSPTGRRIAVGDWDGSVWVLDLSSAGSKGTHLTTKGQVVASVFWLDDDHIVAYTQPHFVEVFELSTGAHQVHRIPDLGNFFTDEAYRDGLYVRDHRLYQVDPSTGKVKGQWNFPGAIEVSGISPQGLIAIGATTSLRIVRFPSMENVPGGIIPLRGLSTLGWTRDGRKLIVCDLQNVLLVDLVTHRTQTYLGSRIAVGQATLNAEGTRIVVSGSDQTLRVLSVSTGECLLALPAAGFVNDARMSPDGSWLVETGSDAKIHLFPTR